MFSGFNFRRSALAFACLSVVGGAHAQSAGLTDGLKPTVVTATRVEQPLTDTVADVSIIDHATIERSGASTVAEVLRQVPGMELARNGGPATTTSVFLRGAPSNFTAVFVDGVRVDSQSIDGGMKWEMLPLAQVDHIEVLRGPAGAIYGSDAISGVVQIFTRKGEGPFSPYAGVGVGTYNTRKLDAGFSGSNGGVDYALGMSRELSTGFPTKSTRTQNDPYDTGSVSARVGVQVNPQNRVEAAVLDNHIDGNYAGFSANLPDPLVQNHLQSVGLNWVSDWTSQYRTRLSVNQGRVSYLGTGPSTFYDVDTTTRSYLWQNEYRLGAHLLTAALERREDSLTDTDYQGATPFGGTRSQNALALGYGYRQGAHTVQLNVRHDQDSTFGGKNTGSVAYAYALTPQWRVTASAATSFRAPTLYQLYSPYGDVTLQPQTARNVEAGLKYEDHGTTFGVVAYRNRVTNLIDFDLTTYRYVNTAHAQYEGVTFSGSQRVGGVRLRGSLDLQNPRNLDTGALLVRRAQQHATVGADTDVSGWNVGAEALFSSMRYDNGNVALGGYSVYNLSATKPIDKDWTLLLRMDNAFNKNYQLVNQYNTPGRTFFAGVRWAPR